VTFAAGMFLYYCYSSLGSQGLKLICECVCLSVCVQVGVSGPRAKKENVFM